MSWWDPGKNRSPAYLFGKLPLGHGIQVVTGENSIISEKYPLDLFITCDEDGYVTVKNSLQPKSKPEPSTQFGLQSIIRRYQLLSDRKVIIEKNDSSFIVRIPIIKKSNTWKY